MRWDLKQDYHTHAQTTHPCECTALTTQLLGQARRDELRTAGCSRPLAMHLKIVGGCLVGWLGGQGFAHLDGSEQACDPGDLVVLCPCGSCAGLTLSVRQQPQHRVCSGCSAGLWLACGWGGCWLTGASCRQQAEAGKRQMSPVRALPLGVLGCSTGVAGL